MFASMAWAVKVQLSAIRWTVDIILECHATAFDAAVQQLGSRLEKL
jgi:hypothetical protein